MGSGRHVGSSVGQTSRMSLWRAVLSECVRLKRSPLIALHLACGLIAGVACGAYFGVAPWDPRLGTDAFVQLIGALMPLMVAIVCGLDVDGEREASGLANLLAVPSRRIALAARVLVLWLLGFIAVAVALGSFSAVLGAFGRDGFSAGVYARATVGMAAGSLVLYVVSVWLALALGRNAAIGVGAAGLACALFAVGGLAHGLVTGELTAASSGVLGYVPFAWAERLGSLLVELGLAADAGLRAVIWQLEVTSVLTLAVTAVGLAALLAWVGFFEEGRRGE